MRRTSDCDPAEMLNWALHTFDIDVVAGKLTWKVPPKNHPRLAGQEVGKDAGNGIIVRRCGLNMRRSWLIFLVYNKRWPNGILVHADGNGTNDAIANLIEVPTKDGFHLRGAASRHERDIGRTYGNLTLADIEDERGEKGRVVGKFLCECGASIKLPIGRVKSGFRSHCGCKANNTPNLTHGMRGTSEYSTWQSMKMRCLNTQSKDYARWGAQGIRIHEPWVNSFEAFYDHVGQRPKGTTLDRIDPNGHYEPGNVRWATPAIQARNKRAAKVWVIKGIEFETLDDAGSHFGKSGHTVWGWVNGRFDRRRGSYTPPKEGCYVRNKY